MKGVLGHLSRPEANWLQAVPKLLGPGLYADLGTFQGRSAILVADGLRTNNLDGKVITVDLFNEKGMTDRTVQGSEEAARANITEKGLDDRIEVVVGYTALTADLFKNEEFNFVFIDADHTYQGCMDDFLAWSPLVRRGGLIAFHDANRSDVLKVLSELDDHDWKLKQWIDTMSIWRRMGVKKHEITHVR